MKTQNIGETADLSDDIFTKLRLGVSRFSAKKSLLCKFILENYQQVAFWSVEELSQNSGISPATVVRTVKSLGYSGYQDMLKCFEKIIIDNKTSVWWEMEKSWDENPQRIPLLPWIAKDNIQAIKNSITPSLLKSIEGASDLLKNANKIFIIAVRSSRAAATFFYSMLSQVFDNIHLMHYGGDELYEHLVGLGSSDVVVAISLGGPHYTQTTIQAVRYTNKQKIPTVLVINDLASPAAKYADITLVVGQTQHHYSLIPALTVLETVIVELGQRKKTEALKKLKRLEATLNEEKITI